MRAIFDFVRIISDSDSHVVITGETGTGKELIANLIHYSSARRNRPFVAVSCAIFTETLIESELFGHERGAFTGAIKERPGRFELAHEGTLFLDDIDDVPLSVQVKLLRAIQTRTIERVGGVHPIPTDVRIITGAKRDLKQLVAEKKFREDLYYRLDVIPILLPPLRERAEDIGVLMDQFITRFFRQRGADPPPVSDVVRQAFLGYTWPGNVRELENACERMAQICVCDRLRVGCLPAHLLLESRARSGRPPVTEDALSSTLSLDEQLGMVERRLIGWALKASAGNKSKAADLLHIKRSTLGDRIRKLGLEDQVEAVSAD